MKYVIEFEDEPFINRNGTKMYRIKGSTSVFVPSSYLYHFPKYEEPAKMPKNDAKRMEELENLEKGDVVLAVTAGRVFRRGLVIFIYDGEEDPYEIVTNCGVVMRRSAKDLFELGYQKASMLYTTDTFFNESGWKQRYDMERLVRAGTVEEEKDEELSDLQPGDIIYKYDSEGRRVLQMVNFVHTCPASYELINDGGWKHRYNLESLVNQGWRKFKGELTTKEFYWRLREEERPNAER